MGWRALGDSAWMFTAIAPSPEERLGRVMALLRQLEAERIPEVADLVASFETLAVHFDPADGPDVIDWLRGQSLPEPDEFGEDGEVFTVPVVYGGDQGPDLGDVAGHLGMTEEDVIRLHQRARYRVAAIGFSPGFPYLLGLPERLCLPRKSSPCKVAAGSVAIAGGQAGIYPFQSQGGWHVIGRSNALLFNPESPRASCMKVGQSVRFKRVRNLDFSMESNSSSIRLDRSFGMQLIEAGMITSIQDMGRPGLQGLGISPGGAMDKVSMSVVNALVGNEQGAAVLECAVYGPVLEAREDCVVAFLGWARGDEGRPLRLKVGEKLDLRKGMRTVRGYVAVAGGLDVPLVMRSRATDLRAGFGGIGGRLLKNGDVIGIGVPGAGPKSGHWKVGWPRSAERGGLVEIRVLAGVQWSWFSGQSRERFLRDRFRISPVSDRTGMRLSGPFLERAEGFKGDMVSQPVVAGSIQVPDGGEAIVLMAERQTIGGYPQIGHVISADLPILARLWPGMEVRFRQVGMDEARTAWLDLRQKLRFLQTGLDFLR